MESVKRRAGDNKKRIASGVEIGNQLYVSREFYRRFPSEIAHISSREWQRVEEALAEERRKEDEARRAVERKIMTAKIRHG